MTFKRLLFTLILLLSVVAVTAQNNSAPQNPIKCAEHIAQESLYQSNPNQRLQDSLDAIVFEQSYQNYLQSFDPSARSTYTIPVVVHVVHLNGEENISDEQIYDAIEKLNEDFSMSNPDVGNTVPAFSGIVGNADIEFKLATKDPNGNCHSGITRTVSSTTYDVGMTWSPRSHPIVDAVAAEHGVWPQGEYMSIFVCIDPIGAAGYTYRPSNGFNQTQMYGAIFMRHDYMGVIGTSSNSSRHTLAHEAGHWLNLAHLWGSTNSPNVASNCNSDDGVADTPNSIGWQTCALQGVSCGSLDNVQNIMEYSFCSTMFTQGQVARMHTAVNASTAGRNNLITNANLAATGVLSPSTDICGAVFTSSSRVICQGQSVTFDDVSVHAVDSRSWIFDGGFPATSAGQNVTVTYDNAGDYSVTLEVSNSTNTETTTITNYVKVLPAPGRSFPYSESFESFNASNFPDDINFATINNGNDFTWEITSDAASTGNKSAYIQNFAADTEGIDQLVSGTIDMSGLDPSEVATFTFDYAYRKRENSNGQERLKVFISNDCGESWDLRKIVQIGLVSSQSASSSFIPTADDWRSSSFSTIGEDYYGPNFRYMFQFESANGNNIYIDNINIVTPRFLSIESVEDEQANITVFPNPANNQSTINLSGFENSNLSVELFNIQGEKVSDIFNGDIPGNVFTVDVDLAAFSAGLYFIRVAGQNVNKTVKLLKQ